MEVHSITPDGYILTDEEGGETHEYHIETDGTEWEVDKLVVDPAHGAAHIEEDPEVPDEVAELMAERGYDGSDPEESGDEEFPCPEDDCEFVGDTRQALAGHSNAH